MGNVGGVSGRGHGHHDKPMKGTEGAEKSAGAQALDFWDKAISGGSGYVQKGYVDLQKNIVGYIAVHPELTQDQRGALEGISKQVGYVAEHADVLDELNEGAGLSALTGVTGKREVTDKSIYDLATDLMKSATEWRRRGQEDALFQAGLDRLQNDIQKYIEEHPDMTQAQIDALTSVPDQIQALASLALEIDGQRSAIHELRERVAGGDLSAVPELLNREIESFQTRYDVYFGIPVAVYTNLTEAFK